MIRSLEMHPNYSPQVATPHHTAKPRNPWRNVGALGAVVVAAILFVGCSSDDDQDASAIGLQDSASVTTDTQTTDDTTTSTSSSTIPTTSPGANDEMATSEPFQAISTAVAAGPGVAVELDLDDDDGERVWEVIVRLEDGSAVEFDISVASGDIVRQESVSLPSLAATPPSVTLEAALRTALDAVDNAQVEDAELDDEDDRIIWDIQLRQATGIEVEVHIDTTTGEIVKHDVDD